GATTFTFSTAVASGGAYAVTVATQPSGELCTVSAGSGTATANVTSVAISCGAAPTYTIGGSVTGLTEDGLTLDDNGGDTLTVAAGASTFAFSTALTSGTAYDVTVATQPTGENCTASSNTGTASANVTSVAIACVESGVMVSTLAGSGSPGFTNGTGTAAKFDGPAGVARDSSGNLYVADSTNNVIRKVTSAGVVTTFAGTGTQGSANGNALTQAEFNGPSGVVVDSAGNVYVVDENNSEIRLINTSGVVSTFAGSTTIGHADGTGTSASFTAPEGIAMDSSGNLWVTDSGNNEIREITTPGAVVTTVAGSYLTTGHANGNGTAASFNEPIGIAVDSSGNLYVADHNNNEIRKITSSFAVSLFAGSSAGTSGSINGTGNNASFSGPFGVTIDSLGNLFVTDANNHEIRMLTPSAVVTTYAGSTTPGNVNGAASTAEFHYPFGITVDSSGNLYIGDYYNDEIREIVP
ncbi:MAG TPA: NHL repeat-containing protein, partial [Steroidobacteraceae bacterium]|nr:NHL repeat-containing protein [Steroidobacteraceae bacterium]